MKLTRPQLILVIVIGIVTIGVYACLANIIARNSQQISQLLVPTATTLPSADQTGEPTSLPTATSVPAPTLAPTPFVPQTRYDLQMASDPQNPALRVRRGYAYIALGAYTHAVEDFDVAIGLDGTLAMAYAGRAEARYYLKEWTAALEDLEMCLALDPGMADARAWHGYLLSEWGRYAPALESLRQAIELDSADPRKHVWLAQALLRSGSPGEAVIEYTTALMLDSRSVEAYVGRAMALAEQGDLVSAQGDLTMAQSLVPYDPVALNGQAWFYAWYLRDNLDEAERLAQRAVAGAEGDLEKARYLHALGWVYCQQGRHEEAVAVLEQAATLATVEGDVAYGEISELLEDVRGAQ